MEDKRVLILLVEGKTDAILYKSLIERTTASRVSNVEYLDYSIRMLLSKIEVSRGIL